MSYIECSAREVPDRVRFDISRRNQGQIIEVAYGGYSAAEHGPGDPFKRVEDRSVEPSSPDRITYYRHSEPISQLELQKWDIAHSTGAGIAAADAVSLEGVTVPRGAQIRLIAWSSSVTLANVFDEVEREWVRVSFPGQSGPYRAPYLSARYLRELGGDCELRLARNQGPVGPDDDKRAAAWVADPRSVKLYDFGCERVEARCALTGDAWVQVWP